MSATPGASQGPPPGSRGVLTAPPALRGTALAPAPTSGSGPGAPALRDRWERLLTAATTEPGRLRIIGAALAVAVLCFGALTAWQIHERAAAARDVVEQSQPLSSDAADIYRYLADADATAASGFLAGGQEPEETRTRYRDDIARAARLLADAAANTEGSPEGQRQIALLTERLPVYAGLVETARANGRQGLPLGGAYLRHASEQMRSTLLPAAERLYEVENARLDQDYADAVAYPWFALAAGVVALAGLAVAQRRLYRRTNRVFNVGLLGATAATAALLLWLVAGHAVARSGLGESEAGGGRSLRVLGEARIGVLKARGDENLTLVARGAGTTYEKNYQKEITALDNELPGIDGGLLEHALLLVDGGAGRAPVERAAESLDTWRKRHTSARASDDAGDYEDAVAKVVGGRDGDGQRVTDTTGAAFDAVDASLSGAVRHEQARAARAADDGRGAFTGLPVGAVVLTVAGAAAGVLGMARRLAEYR